MPPKQNCWEIKLCGREPGGPRSSDMGICPAASDKSAEGLNGGRRGGRICWAVAGTFCGGLVQGSFAMKQVTCMSCEVYLRVREEEGANNFLLLKPGQNYQAPLREGPGKRTIRA